MTGQRYTIYRESDGQISGAFRSEIVPDVSWTAPGYSLLASDDDDPALYYVTGSPPSITLRPASLCVLSKAAILANGADIATITNIPVGANVVVHDINGMHRYTVTDGVLEITADAPGAIRVTIESFPARDFSATVTAA